MIPKNGDVLKNPFLTLMILVGRRSWQFDLGAQCTSWIFPVEDEDLLVGLLPERQLDLYEHQTNPALSKRGEETSSCFGVEVQLEDNIGSLCFLQLLDNIFFQSFKFQLYTSYYTVSTNLDGNHWTGTFAYFWLMFMVHVGR